MGCQPSHPSLAPAWKTALDPFVPRTAGQDQSETPSHGPRCFDFRAPNEGLFMNRNADSRLSSHPPLAPSFQIPALTSACLSLAAPLGPGSLPKAPCHHAERGEGELHPKHKLFCSTPQLSPQPCICVGGGFPGTQ